MILAGIDIGTNTIRLLVAETSDTSHQEIHSGRIITRLGQGLDRTGVLAPDAQERSLRAIEEFASVLGRHAVVRTAVVGTSALRNAGNASAFIAAVKERTGLEIAVISGQDEAMLTLSGVRRALSLKNGKDDDPLASAIVVDIGGGSTELIITRQGRISSTDSLPLGAVYLTERFVRHDPPSGDEIDSLRRTARDELDQWEQNVVKTAGMDLASHLTCAGTAGTITTLAAIAQGLREYDPDCINGYILSKASLDEMVIMLSTTRLDARKMIPGLESGREDIILAGAIVVQEIMETCGARELLISDWGLREGIVFDLYEKLRNTRSTQ
jgi:exopolyphosphatase/guanosine-5'-triphosphate,3'-diphosphate pyrophosphatase